MVYKAALATSVLAVAIVLLSFAYNPRLWIQDLPEGIQAEMEPLTPKERIVRVFVAGLLLSVVIGIPVLSVLGVKASQGDITFLEAFLHIWLIFMTVNLVDLVILDWLIGVWWQPRFLSTPEIEERLDHITYRFHLVEHIKGTALLTVLALGLGVLVSM